MQLDDVRFPEIQRDGKADIFHGLGTLGTDISTFRPFARVIPQDKMNSTERATIFVAHSNLDLVDARVVRNLFEDLDHDVLLLKLSQRMTDEYLRNLLQREIRARDWMVVISSGNARHSDWVDFEETYARDRAKPVFYIRLEKCSHFKGNDRKNCIETQVSSISRAIRVFFSYHRADMGIARQMATDLGERGFEVWLDMESIPVGASFTEEIQRAIDRTLARGAMVVLVSSRSMESEWVLTELNYALGKEGRVVPCLVEPRPAVTPLELQTIQLIDFTADYEKGFQRLLHALEV